MNKSGPAGITHIGAPLDEKTLPLPDRTADGVGVVDIRQLKLVKVLASIPVGPRPRSTAFLPDGSVAYVPSENGATVTVIDTKALKATKIAPRRVIATIPVGRGPWGAAFVSR